MSNCYQVDFQVVKKSAASGAGPAYAYRRTQRTALVSAASDQGVQAVLNTDVSLLSGETIEILHTHTVTVGTEGVAVLA
jgi:hypothetical protein